MVLIESDWNLKSESRIGSPLESSSINRIRLEFKVCSNITERCCTIQVLIESDWNLKCQHQRGGESAQGRINRIRLEFKAAPYVDDG